jgi:hypothetical protein
MSSIWSCLQEAVVERSKANREVELLRQEQHRLGVRGVSLGMCSLVGDKRNRARPQVYQSCTETFSKYSTASSSLQLGSRMVQHTLVGGNMLMLVLGRQQSSSDSKLDQVSLHGVSMVKKMSNMNREVYKLNHLCGGDSGVSGVDICVPPGGDSPNSHCMNIPLVNSPDLVQVILQHTSDPWMELGARRGQGAHRGGHGHRSGDSDEIFERE